MIKQSKKKVSLLIVFCMVLTMLFGYAAPVAASSAIGGTVVGNVPTIVATGNVNLASIRFAETVPGNLGNNATIEVTLPSGMVFRTGLTGTPNTYYEALNVDVSNVAFSNSNRTMTLTLSRTSLLSNAVLLVKLPANQTATPPATGNVVATVVTNTTAVTGGDFSVGSYGSGSLSISSTVTTIPTVGRFVAGGQAVRNFQLKENATGAFKAGAPNKLVLTLPSGVTWTGATVTGAVYQVDTTDARKLNVWLNSSTGSATTFTVSGSVNVSRLAALGDMVVALSGEGTNNNVSGSLVVAKVADFAISVGLPTNAQPEDINAGRGNQAFAAFEIKESTPGSLISGGTIELTVPEGYQWAGAPTIDRTAGTGTVGTPTLVANTGNRTYRATVTAASTTNTTLRVSGNVNVSPTAAAGDVAVTVGGTASAEGSVVVAKTRRVFDVAAASVASVRVAVNGQAAGDIVITEAAAGRIIGAASGREITITLPTGVTFDGTPTVTRTGNVTLGTATASGNTLTIPVTATGTTASVITISGIKYNVDRLVANGNIEATVAGSALVDVYSPVLNPAFPTVKVFNARIGAAGVTVFTIGATTYTVDGRSMTMDVAPFIKNGRTMLPLRFTAEAAGVNTEEIIWDSVRRTVTLIRGDRVVQVQIGSTTMLINGIAVTMDVAPEIVNGRTVLPMRWVGMALRANVEWNETNKTVHVMPL